MKKLLVNWDSMAKMQTFTIDASLCGQNLNFSPAV